MKRLTVFICAFLALTLPVAAQQDDDGQGFLTRLLQDQLSGAGRTVRIEGFKGSLSANASLDRLTIADEQGVWLTLTSANLRWTRSALLRGRIEVDSLTADTLVISRSPESGETMPAPEASGFSLPDLPVSVDIGALLINRVDLAPEILGQPFVAQVEGSASLAGGSGEATVTAQRLDSVQGKFAVAARFDKASEVLGVDIELREASGGLASHALNLPGDPSVALTLAGTGPLSDFTAKLALATDGQERLAGTIELRNSAGEDAAARQLTADISGDITALFAPEYRSFFGKKIALTIAAERAGDGAVEVSAFDLRAQKAHLSGSLSLAPDGWPQFLDIAGEIGDPTGELTLLPGGDDIQVGHVALSVAYDAAKGDTWQGRFDIVDLQRPDVQVGAVQLLGSGTLTAPMGVVNKATADLQVSASAITGLAPEIARVLGQDLSGKAKIEFTEDAPVLLRDLTLNLSHAQLSGKASIGGIAAGLPTEFDLALVAQDFSRFDGLAGRPLTGAGDLKLTGTAAPLAGTFDLDLNGTTRAVALGIEQLDALLSGQSRLALSARRDATGTFVEDALISNEALRLSAEAALKTDSSTASFALRLPQVARVAPGIPGALELTGSARQSAAGWVIESALSGPYGLRADVSGPVTGSDLRLAFNARLPDVSVLADGLRGPLALDGVVTRPEQAWGLVVNLAGVADTRARVEGQIGADGRPDLTVRGAIPLGLAQRFIAPRAIAGTADFDLRLAGGYALDALSGTIGTQDARLSLPTLSLAIEQLNLQARLSGGSAQLTASGRPSRGGQITGSGQISLTGARSVAVTARLDEVVIADPQLYETRVSGDISVAGPLSRPRVSGALALGETNVMVPVSGLTSIADIPPIRHVGASQAVRVTQARAGLSEQEVAAANGAKAAQGLPLDVTISAPARIFVRGRGLDAELGGGLRLSGTTTAPISAGQFNLIRGRLDILERRFDLTTGSVQIQGSMTPYIRFVASTPTDAGSAQVTVEGLASAPRITFSSIPEAPQDEVLAQLLFGRSLSQMSALQAFQLANAVAVLAGQSGAGLIGSLRAGFGLDDIDITTAEDGTTQARVGKYISDKAYTDVAVDARGRGEVSINIDLAPNLTAKGKLGAEGNSALGLFFEKDY